jgi:hypothetical protein
MDRTSCGDDRIVSLVGRELVPVLCEPVKPFVGNRAAVRLCRRLASASGAAGYAHYADQIVAGLGSRAFAQGPAAAEYVLALRRR